MKAFWRRRYGPLDLEAELRAGRPEPRPELLRSLAEHVQEESGRRRRARAPRLALTGAMTAAMLVALAAVGGFGYAATAVKQAAQSVGAILTSSNSPKSVEVRGLSAGGDQYQPGYGWGDPNHSHSGPPGLTRKGGAFVPPLQTSCAGGAARISARVVVDEQADLRVSVLGPGGEKLLLSQNGSRVGGATSGSQTKTIRYRLLVPRVIRITLRVPCNLLAAGGTYRIHIAAIDPGGQSSALDVPFRVGVAAA